MSQHIDPPASDNAAFDPRQTDSRRMRMEALKDMGVITSARIIPNYKGHRIEIWNDIHKGTRYHIEGPRFKTPDYDATSARDAEIKAKALLDEVIR